MSGPDVTEERTRHAHPGIKCPRCGNADLRRIRYLENIVVHRAIRGVLPDDAGLEIEARYETGEGYDDGILARFECWGREDAEGGLKTCFNEWSPAVLREGQIEWVE